MGLFGSSSPKETVTVAPGTTADGGYAPMKREERKKCWEARDAYFGCLDRNNILDSIKEADAATKACPKEEQLYEKDCATSWIQYFKQKRVADYERAQKIKKLEAEGAVPMSQANEGSKFKLW